MHSKRLQKVEEVCSFLIGAPASAPWGGGGGGGDRWQADNGGVVQSKAGNYQES